MKAIIGFFMAWGMFLAIPCPVKRWEESARPYMLAAFPLTGLMIGGLWSGASLLLSFLPRTVFALLMAALPWLCTGFIHLDGFMDVCDAVLSRRDLATRQKILKDPHCGAFGVISIVLLILSQWSLFASSSLFHWSPLLFLPVVSRACAGLAILLLPPMGTSQYAQISGKRGGFLLFLCTILAAAAILPFILCRSFSGFAVTAVYWLCAWRGCRQLGGMNGDISGFSLTCAELAGIAVLILVR